MYCTVPYDCSLRNPNDRSYAGLASDFECGFSQPALWRRRSGGAALSSENDLIVAIPHPCTSW